MGFHGMGFLVSQHGQPGAIPPPSFLSISPLESMQSGGAIPPPEKGYLSDTCAIPYENKANGCDTPLCDTMSKGHCAIWGISHWAAKVTDLSQDLQVGTLNEVALVLSGKNKWQRLKVRLVLASSHASRTLSEYFTPSSEFFKSFPPGLSLRIHAA